MKRTHANYLNMVKAVLAHFDSDKNQWQSNALIFSSVTRMRGFCSQIESFSVKQQDNNTVGHTEAKEAIKDLLEEKVYTISLRLRAYAKLHKDEVLAAKLNLSRSSLDRLPFNDFLVISHMIADTCKSYLTQLNDYKITAETIADLEAAISEVAKLYATRDHVFDQRIEMTAKISDLFGEIRNELKLLDDLMEAFITNNEFLAIYIHARRIHDLHGHKANTLKQ